MKEGCYEAGWEMWCGGQDEVRIFYQLQCFSNDAGFRQPREFERCRVDVVTASLYQ